MGQCIPRRPHPPNAIALAFGVSSFRFQGDYSKTGYFSQTMATSPRPAALGIRTLPLTTTLPNSVRYVKNGPGGRWWATAKAEGQIHAS